jgi:two-component system sensor histidine kinase YesM
MQTEIKNLLEQAIRRERSLKRAEISALQAQINPHFLSNTLNAVRIMADLQNAKGISAIVKALAGMLQSTFSRTNEDVTVEEELRALEDYFFILRVRFKGAIRFVVHLEDEGLRQCTLLRFLLQPLVENAVFHGIEPKGTGGEVTLSFSRNRDQLVIRVRDDGVGLEERQRERLLSTASPAPEDDPHRGVRSGLGIFNIHRRIKIAYGDPYGLHYESEVGAFTCVTVTLPLQPC